MKYQHQGFAMIVIITIIALLVIGSGVYFYTTVNNGNIEDIINKSENSFSEFRSNSLGIYFKYPKDFRVTEVDVDTISLLYPENTQGSGENIVLQIKSSKVSLEDFINEYTSIDGFNKIVKQESIQFDGKSATLLFTDSAYGLITQYLFIIHNGRSYIIHHSGHPAHIQVINSLRFI